MSDSNGDWPRWLKTAVRVVKIAYKCLAIANSYENSKVDSNPATTTENTIINDQNGTTGANFKYGMHSASHNSCETIAVHNAKVLEGMDSTLSETMWDFQSAGAMIGDGYFGSNPYAIGKVLSNEGISYSRVGLSGMTEPGTYIISFWNDEPLKNGLHTVAVSYDGSVYTAYNLKGYGGIENINLSDYKRKFICGYYLE